MALDKSAQVGEHYIYDHKFDEGLGQAARGQALTAEMTELDLVDGMLVEIAAIDEETGEPIIHWIDSKMIDRMTTIITADFGQHFVLQ